MWRWSKTMSATYTGVSWNSKSMFFGTIVPAGGSRLGFTVVVTWSFASTVIALLIDMVFGIPFSQIVITWLFTSVTVNGPAVRSSSSFYCVKSYFSSVIKTCDGRSTETCCSIVKFCTAWIFSSKYHLYLPCHFVKGFETYSGNAATWCSMFWRINLLVCRISCVVCEN